MKRLTVLGSTGSIGVNTLEVVAAQPQRFQVEALTAGRNLDLLEKQIVAFKPKQVAVPNPEDAERLRDAIERRKMGSAAPRILHGTAGLVSCAVDSEAELVVSAIVGAAGLEPTLAAIEAGKDIALANKETLVAAGELVMQAVAKSGCRLFPVDSEHSAIFQSLEGHRKGDVKRLILTASGGPFRNFDLEQLAQVKPADALAHPN
ncbi:MAG: 1-deoxy-D-xylulose-5-phosphate reductoisomerase, partial [Desulfuromonadales bacterium]|nr:1-deoxy-D-xylulose-5-phosphate reductoisomerase [Desulfuromonadales bacterium]